MKDHILDEDIESDDDASTTENVLIARKEKISERVGMLAGRKRSRRGYRKNYPKKALTAYNIFFKETREKILTEHGKTNFQEMVRKIAALWKEITPEDKLRFDAIASRDLARYKWEVKEYEQSIVEKNRDTISTKEDAKVHTVTPPIRSPAFNMVPRASQLLPNNFKAGHTLTSNELQLAKHHLKEEVSNSEETQTIEKHHLDLSPIDMKGKRLSTANTLCPNIRGRTDLARSKQTSVDAQQYQANLIYKGLLGGESTERSREAIIGNRIALDLHDTVGSSTSINHNIKKRARLGILDGRHSVISNGLGYTSRQGSMAPSDSSIGKGTFTALEANHVRNLVCEAGVQPRRSDNHIGRYDPIALSALNEKKIQQLLDQGRAYTPAFNENEIRKYLSKNNQISRPNDTEIRNQQMSSGISAGLQKAVGEGELMRRMVTVEVPLAISKQVELRNRISMNGVQNQLQASEVELKKKLAIIQNQKAMVEELRHNPHPMTMNGMLEEIRLREQVQQRNRFITHSGRYIPSSVHSELVMANLIASQAANRSSLSSGVSHAESITSKSLNNAVVRSQFHF